MSLLETAHNIAQVSRLSGIPKDLLRQWERRYGYPNPERDENGDRVYSSDQLDKLLLIRLLVDQGKRPGKLVSLSIDDLKSMLKIPEPTTFDSASLIDLLKRADSASLSEWFEQQLQAYGLRRFVHQVMAPATQAVGEAWGAGEIAIHEEHLYTEVMKNLARKHLGVTDGSESAPRVMLTTVPGEQHSLGLLMVEILLRLAGAHVNSFGTEMPFNEIREAAEQHRVDIIALSFSASFKADDAVVVLSGLRQLIPNSIAIWAGGAAFKDSPALPEGIERMEDLSSVEAAISRWGKSDSNLN